MAQNDQAKALQTVAEVEAHVRDRRIDLLADDFKRLQALPVDSGGADFYNRQQALERAVIRRLFEGMPIDAFATLVSGRPFHAYEVYQALDEMHESISPDQIALLCAKIGPPYAHWSERLFRKLVAAPGEALTRQLAAEIDARAPAEAERGASLSDTRKSVAGFQAIHMLPDDKGLSARVAVLGRRTDPAARALQRTYLLTLPWGQDRQASAALLEALTEEDSPAAQELLCEALAHHTALSEWRLALLSALARRDPAAALRQAARDLAQEAGEEERALALNWIAARAADALDPEDLRAIGESLAELPTEGWSMFNRGHLGLVLQKRFPAAGAARVSSLADRAAMRLILLFERARLDHMGCFVSIPLILALGIGWVLLLNRLIGQPRSMPALDVVTFAAWVLTTIVTSRTHFAGYETLRTKFGMAAAFFGLPAAFVAISVAIRL